MTRENGENLPKNIRRRGQGYMVDYVDQSGTRHRITRKTLRAAKEELRLLKQEDTAQQSEHWRRRRRLSPGLRTLGDALEHCKATRWAHARSSHHAIRNARDAVEHIGPSTRLIEIDVTTIREYRDHLAEMRGISPATVNRKLSALSVLLTEAYEKGAISTVPKARRMRESRGRTRWLNDREIEKLLAAMRYLYDAGDGGETSRLTVFLLNSGLRVGQEALNIQKDDLRALEGGRSAIYVPDGKGGRPRLVPLTGHAVDAIRQQVSETPKERSKVWTLAYYTYRRRFLRACEQAGADLDDVTIHTLRHTCASRLAQQGVPLQVIKDWLGHAAIATTMRYAHLATEHLVGAADVMDRVNSGAED